MFLILSLLFSTNAYINVLQITDDDRSSFFINRFGFGEQGHMILSFIEDFKVEPKLNRSEPHFGFMITVKTKDESFVNINPNCPFVMKGGDPLLKVIPSSAGRNTTIEFEVRGEGFYHLHFINCAKDTRVTFKIELQQYHGTLKEKNYLPIGLFGLPILLFILFGSYIIAIIVWICFSVRRDIKSANIVHTLMTVLVFLKMLSVFSRAVEYHFLESEGVANGWNIPFYLFTFSKGVMTMVVIGLIGVGYNLFKFYLTPRDRKIFITLIGLQLLANFAQIEVWEGSLGSRPTSMWITAFQCIDVVCCIALMVHIGLSSQHLEQAASTDGKAARVMMKLKLFRQFYQMVVAYLYLTRIVVLFLDMGLPFRFEWFSLFFVEVVTFIFYILIGYKFRPQEDSPYFKVHEEDLTDLESDMSVEILQLPLGTIDIQRSNNTLTQHHPTTHTDTQ